MNFQDKVVETAADIRVRAAAIAELGIAKVGITSDRAHSLKQSLSTLRSAGLEFNEVARRFVTRWVKENGGLARETRREVTALARATYSKLTEQDEAPVRRARKAVKRRPSARTRAKAKVV